MSIESRWTIGAMASKNASEPSPVEACDRVGERARGQRAGGDDHAVPVRGRKARDLAALERDERVAQRRALDGGRESVAVDGERSARRDLVGVARSA